MYSQGAIDSAPMNGTESAVDGVRLLDLPGATTPATTDLPEQLLAAADALARPGVEEVVGGAQASRRGQRQPSARRSSVDEVARG